MALRWLPAQQSSATALFPRRKQVVVLRAGNDAVVDHRSVFVFEVLVLPRQGEDLNPNVLKPELCTLHMKTRKVCNISTTQKPETF